MAAGPRTERPLRPNLVSIEGPDGPRGSRPIGTNTGSSLWKHRRKAILSSLRSRLLELLERPVNASALYINNGPPPL